MKVSEIVPVKLKSEKWKNDNFLLIFILCWVYV